MQHCCPQHQSSLSADACGTWPAATYPRQSYAAHAATQTRRTDDRRSTPDGPVLISALTILASVGLLETAKRRDRKWWDEAASGDPNDPNTANLATITLLRIIDLAHYAWWPAALGVATGLAAIWISTTPTQMAGAVVLTLAAIATASYTYTARERITNRTHKPNSDGASATSTDV